MRSLFNSDSYEFEDYTVLSETKQRARKEHCCGYCRNPIEKGEVYLRVVVVGGEGLYVSKKHSSCQESED